MSGCKEIDQQGAHAAVRSLLEALGEAPLRNGLVDTPQRVTAAWKEMTWREEPLESAAGNGIFDLEEFEGDPGWVVVKDIPFSAVCSETLLPYHGVCHVAYKINQNRILGLSKAARIIHVASKGIHSQQQLGDLVKKTIEMVSASNEVAVILKATHIYYDRPIVVLTTSSIAQGLEKNNGRVEDLMMLLGVEEWNIKRQKITGVYDFKIDPIVLEKMQSSITQLFDRIGTTADQNGLAQYSHQLYCATIGQRVASLPSEIGQLDGMYDVTDKNETSPFIAYVIDFRSLCEHHLLPFYGKIFIGCTSDSSDGLSITQKLKESLSRKVWNAARRPQVQERLTNEVADMAIRLEFVKATVVVCEAVHLCMIARGARTHSSLTRTVTRRGDIPNALIQLSKGAIQF